MTTASTLWTPGFDPRTSCEVRAAAAAVRQHASSVPQVSIDSSSAAGVGSCLCSSLCACFTKYEVLWLCCCASQ
jgi:hypothetical protein